MGLSLLAASLIALPESAAAQNRFALCPGFTPNVNVDYTGKFAFLRVRYVYGFGGDGYGGRRGRMGGWSHDYPTAECHFNKLLTNLTSVKAHLDGSVITTLDDPDLFKFPIAYFSEPGEWGPSESEVLALRQYLQKGGFAIFDDFEGMHIINLQRQMERVIPGMRLVELDTKHPIFDTFYRVKSLEMYHPQTRQRSTFYGIFEDNDPKKRMLAVVNHDNDIGDYWEWSDTGMYGLDPSNEAYKLGINYIVWAMTR